MEKEKYKGNYNKDLLEQYKIYVEMMDRISSRRYKSNSFYISLLSGITAFIALIYQFFPNSDLFISNVSIIFILILSISLCIIWFIHVGSYRQLNNAKFKIIHKMEKKLPYECYKKEWDKIKKKFYIKLTVLEQVIPIIFIIIFIVLIIFSLPIFS